MEWYLILILTLISLWCGILFAEMYIHVFTILNLLNCRSSLYVVDVSLLPDIRVQIFSHSVSCLFILSIVFFDAQAFLILMKCNLFFFCRLCFSLCFFLRGKKCLLMKELLMRQKRDYVEWSKSREMKNRLF